MTYYLLLPVVSVALVVVQTALPEILSFRLAGLELSLVLVAYAGFHLTLARGSLLAFTLGFTLDCLSGIVVGFFTTVYVIVYFLAYAVSLQADTRKASLVVSFTFCGALLEGALIMLLRTYVFHVHSFAAIARVVVLQAVVLAALSPLLFNAFHRLEVFLFHGTGLRTHQ
jgi:hypothetical protein